ncbi:hypothetical protein CSUI_008386 [Cystoisospora suis]|uniref:Uncharacterized protein n=1 Tax=Cystoisospora suis TaxID=483139 RepID=A0A2C6JNV3_9APIC|nr:hypothetical protein CSUI_008386 [Cystoisospora suis]
MLWVGPEHDTPTWSSLSALQSHWAFLTRMTNYRCPISCLSSVPLPSSSRSESSGFLGFSDSPSGSVVHRSSGLFPQKSERMGRRPELYLFFIKQGAPYLGV